MKEQTSLKIRWFLWQSIFILSVLLAMFISRIMMTLVFTNMVSTLIFTLVIIVGPMLFIQKVFTKFYASILNSMIMKKELTPFWQGTVSLLIELSAVFFLGYLGYDSLLGPIIVADQDLTTKMMLKELSIYSGYLALLIGMIPFFKLSRKDVIRLKPLSKNLVGIRKNKRFALLLLIFSVAYLAYAYFMKDPIFYVSSGILLFGFLVTFFGYTVKYNISERIIYIPPLAGPLKYEYSFEEITTDDGKIIMTRNGIKEELKYFKELSDPNDVNKFYTEIAKTHNDKE